MRLSYKVHKDYRVRKVVMRLLWAFCFMSFTLIGWGQNKEFVKKNFKNNSKGLKKAVDSIKKGDAYYAMGAHYYRYAIPYYMSAERFNPDNAVLNYKIGKCLIYSSMKSQAVPYLKKAISLNPVPISAPDLHYYLGRAFHLTMNWDSAKQEYNIYLQTLSPARVAEIADVRKKMEECDNGKLLCQTPVRVFVDNLGSTINTKYPEYRPEINADETQLFYTSRMPATSKAEIDPKDGETYEDIFVSYYRNGAWSTSASIGAPINTKSHDATAGLSPDGQTLYVYRTNDNGDLYQTHLTNNVWSKPQRMSDKINSDGKETGISVSPDGKVIYFVSDRPGGYGFGDIYKTISDDKGNWSLPQNLGPAINTQYDEQGVFMSPDGVTLYFSSMGHNTMGGYDIFKSVFTGGQWSAPENLGYPINTPDDDVFYVMPANNPKHAYYSSCQPGGGGDMDIYMITFLGPEKPMAISNSANLLSGTANIPDVLTTSAVTVAASNTALLKGIVVDSETHQPLFATIKLTDNKKNKLVATFTTDSTTGNYVVSLLSGINYGIAVTADKHLFYSANIDMTDSSHYREIEKDVALQPLEVGSHIALRNIFFDFNKSTLRKESNAELQRVIDLLKKYPTLKIEISGYTDSKGTQAYNLKLSSARAKSVVTYLTTHGIAASRLTSKGYGADNPVATNTTDEGRQLNRRTEFKITGK
jgi:outer membrane protein OmpA-like peptidoglycan-associated protein